MITVYFGEVGAGKSCHASMLVKTCFKKYKGKIYSNVPIKGAYLIDSADIGKYSITDALVIIDEAGIDFNNRSYKSLDKDVIKWLKLHRHYGCDVVFYSQAYCDMDITIRRLAHSYALIRRSRILPLVSSVIPIKVKIGINEMTKEIVDEYVMPTGLAYLFQRKHFFRPKYYKMFDSFSAPLLPEKEFTRYGYDTSTV